VTSLTAPPLLQISVGDAAQHHDLPYVGSPEVCVAERFYYCRPSCHDLLETDTLEFNSSAPLASRPAMTMILVEDVPIVAPQSVFLLRSMTALSLSCITNGRTVRATNMLLQGTETATAATSRTKNVLARPCKVLAILSIVKTLITLKLRGTNAGISNLQFNSDWQPNVSHL
jgi:hypothetical protein